MDDVMISIIIPAYNAAKTLKKCLDSLKDQRCFCEVIVVDDGSNDDTAEQCDGFNKIFAGGFQLIKTANQGVSAARNAGISAAKGKYISFVDADDSVQPGMIGYMVEIAERRNADLVCGDFFLIGENGVHYGCELAGFSKDFASKNALCKVIRDYLYMPRGVSFFTNVWGKLYLRQLISDNHIEFDTGLTTWEDTVFNCQYFSLIKNFCYIHEYVYNYHLNPGVGSGGAKLFLHPFGHRIVIDVLLNTLRTAGETEMVLEKLKYRSEAYFAVKNLLVAAGLVLDGKAEKGQLHKLIRTYCRDLIIIAAMRSYRPGKGESFWLPLLLKLKFAGLAEKYCLKRAAVQRRH